MLTELKIKDFAIIDELSINFTGGMNIFTGETGAGKSIIIDAVNLILGGRGSSDYVRTGCSEAKVEALFDISQNSALKSALTNLGHEPSDELIIKRILSLAGKSKLMINDSFSTLNALNKLSPMLINIYGQNEHQELLNRDRHLEMLDTFAGHSHLVDQYKKSFLSLREVEEKLDKLSKIAENKDKEIGFIKFQLSEISAANMKEGEEEELKKEKGLLLNAEKILESCAFGFEHIYSKSGSISTVLSEILDRLEKVKTLDSSFENYHCEVRNALYALEDAAFFFRDYPKRIDFTPSSLDEIESRLNSISEIKKKYGESVERVFETKAELEERLKELNDVIESSGLLEERQAELFKKTTELAGRLSDKRRLAADTLKSRMSEELKSLAMPNAGFIAKFEELARQPKLCETGADAAEFYFSANPGEEFKPLLKVASGGELSRVMLALKNVTKGEGAVSTFIFDEVDAGIGGKTAHIVGAKLKRLSLVNQVICITHLSQIASYADSYYYVTKAKKDGRMVTRVKELDHDGRIKEVARLLSGEKITEHSLKHAGDMIAKNRREVI
jgi:DNA repair protein RecN (Recombination protein N)